MSEEVECKLHTCSFVANQVRGLITLVLSLLVASFPAQGQTAETSESLPDFAHVEQQAMELKQSMLTYSENKRQDLIAETQAVLEKFDQRIGSLQSSIAANEAEMSSAARRYADNMLDTLGRQRSHFNDRLKALESDSRETWDHLMYEFSTAFDEFYNYWEKLELEFGSGTY